MLKKAAAVSKVITAILLIWLTIHSFMIQDYLVLTLSLLTMILYILSYIFNRNITIGDRK
ncbi:hypothetical protein [Metabacillus idriensis]|uniref:hypothetical protein n=1 Tax=Metabacillus idriensis TaxID=324768 RepID=UPI00174A8647|nr:hypothetical protein [Metabacillus idriensis]